MTALRTAWDLSPSQVSAVCNWFIFACTYAVPWYFLQVCLFTRPKKKEETKFPSPRSSIIPTHQSRRFVCTWKQQWPTNLQSQKATRNNLEETHMPLTLKLVLPIKQKIEIEAKDYQKFLQANLSPIYKLIKWKKPSKFERNYFLHNSLEDCIAPKSQNLLNCRASTFNIWIKRYQKVGKKGGENKDQ